MSDNDVSPDSPVRLLPVSIAKPWGREIWYSAIEQRGESRVATGGSEIPLSSYLAAVGLPDPIILLKVLDPYPEPVRGDLYFEVHDHKHEVYVVTAIDRVAWPDGRGRIRYGMSQKVRRRYGNDQAFRKAYLQAVRGYERLRRRIDRGARIAADEEAGHRAVMDAFTSLEPVEVGDVVTVPTWTPHALQHGVRVVEFQTPTYERYIISFAQQVKTQHGWDSEYAIARMCLDPPPGPVLEPVADGVDGIASFSGFGVWRAVPGPARPVALPEDAPYAICMALDGHIDAGPLRLAPEEACLVPAAAFEHCRISASAEARCLIAAPGI